MHGVNIKMLKEGMTIEARHVKRKQLTQYLDAEFLKSERKTMENHTNFNNSLIANRKRLSTELAQTQEQQQLQKGKESGAKLNRLSESFIEDNSNASSEAGAITPTTPTSAQKTAPTFSASNNASVTASINNGETLITTADDEKTVGDASPTTQQQHNNGNGNSNTTSTTEVACS